MLKKVFVAHDSCHFVRQFRTGTVLRKFNRERFTVAGKNKAETKSVKDVYETERSRELHFRWQRSNEFVNTEKHLQRHAWQKASPAGKSETDSTLDVNLEEKFFLNTSKRSWSEEEKKHGLERAEGKSVKYVYQNQRDRRERHLTWQRTNQPVDTKTPGQKCGPKAWSEGKLKVGSTLDENLEKSSSHIGKENLLKPENKHFVIPKAWAEGKSKADATLDGNLEKFFSQIGKGNPSKEEKTLYKNMLLRGLYLIPKLEIKHVEHRRDAEFYPNLTQLYSSWKPKPASNDLNERSDTHVKPALSLRRPTRLYQNLGVVFSHVGNKSLSKDEKKICTDILLKGLHFVRKMKINEITLWMDVRFYPNLTKLYNSWQPKHANALNERSDTADKPTLPRPYHTDPASWVKELGRKSHHQVIIRASTNSDENRQCAKSQGQTKVNRRSGCVSEETMRKCVVTATKSLIDTGGACGLSSQTFSGVCQNETLGLSSQPASRTDHDGLTSPHDEHRGTVRLSSQPAPGMDHMHIANSSSQPDPVDLGETVVLSSQHGLQGAVGLYSQPDSAGPGGSSTQLDFEGTVGSPSQPDDGTALLSSQPDIEGTVGLSSQPNLEVTVGLSSQPDIEDTVGLSSQPDLEGTVGLSSQPDLEGTVGLSSQPDLERTVGLSSQPDLEVTVGLSSQPDLEGTVGLSSQPEFTGKTIPSSMHHDAQVIQEAKNNLREHIQYYRYPRPVGRGSWLSGSVFHFNQILKKLIFPKMSAKIKDAKFEKPQKSQHFKNHDSGVKTHETESNSHGVGETSMQERCNDAGLGFKRGRLNESVNATSSMHEQGCNTGRDLKPRPHRHGVVAMSSMHERGRKNGHNLEPRPFAQDVNPSSSRHERGWKTGPDLKPSSFRQDVNPASSTHERSWKTDPNHRSSRFRQDVDVISSTQERFFTVVPDLGTNQLQKDVDAASSMHDRHFNISRKSKADLACEQALLRNIPSASQLHEREDVCESLQQVLREYYDERILLSLFGSSKNGFAFHDSDLDISLTMKGDSTGREFSSPKMVHDISGILRKLPGVARVRPIAFAQVPIIKFYLTNEHYEADISMFNSLAVRNTNMLACYANIDERCRILGFVLKSIAKKHFVCSPTNNTLSSYAYLLLVIYFLQQTTPPVLPVLQELYRGRDSPELIVDGWNSWFYDDIKNLPSVWNGFGNNTKSVGQLWLDLIHFYKKEFDFSNEVVSIRRIARLTKQEKIFSLKNFRNRMDDRRRRRRFRHAHWDSRWMYIEDPFDHNHNLAAGLSPHTAKTVRSVLYDKKLQPD